MNRNANKRYTLVIPQGMYDEVEQIAEQRHATVIDLLRKFIKLGILAVNLEDDPNAALVIREGDTEKEIMML